MKALNYHKDGDGSGRWCVQLKKIYFKTAYTNRRLSEEKTKQVH